MNEELMALLRGADLSDETIAQAKTLLLDAETKRQAASADLEASTARKIELENELETANADAADLRSIVQDAVDASNEVRVGLTEVTSDLAAEIVRRGQFEESVALRTARAKGEDDLDPELISAERLAAMETDNQSIPGTWRAMMTSYSREYGEFIPRFAPEMGKAPTHVANLQAIRLPGETPHFVDETRGGSVYRI